MSKLQLFVHRLRQPQTLGSIRPARPSPRTRGTPTRRARPAGAQRRGHHRDATERADGWVVVHRGSMSDGPTDERGTHGTAPALARSGDLGLRSRPGAGPRDRAGRRRHLRDERLLHGADQERGRPRHRHRPRAHQQRHRAGSRPRRRARRLARGRDPRRAAGRVGRRDADPRLRPAQRRSSRRPSPRCSRCRTGWCG